MKKVLVYAFIGLGIGVSGYASYLIFKKISDARIDSKTVSEPAETFFLTGNVAERIKSNLNIKQLLIPQMGMQFVDYTLS